MHPTDLTSYGFDSFFESSFISIHKLPGNESLIPARILSCHRGSFTAVCTEGIIRAEVSGRFRIHADEADFPVTGDWTAIRYGGEDGISLIEYIIPRKSVLFRRKAGSDHDLQYMAANADILFIVQSLDTGFNVRSLERYTAAAREGGAEPVLLMTKADLLEGPASETDEIRNNIRQEAEHISAGMPVLFLSAIASGIPDELRSFLNRGRTAVFMGKSGAGKSTLINALLGEEIMKTQEVRRSDRKGKHTTVTREIFLLPEDQGLIMDTPGMREFGVYLSSSNEDIVFSDIASLAEKCRFRDCTHTGEPGCAVQEAVNQGLLSGERLQSLKKFRNETMTASEKKAKWKNIAKSVKELYEFREKNR